MPLLSKLSGLHAHHSFLEHNTTWICRITVHLTLEQISRAAAHSLAINVHQLYNRSTLYTAVKLNSNTGK